MEEAFDRRRACTLCTVELESGNETSRKRSWCQWVTLQQESPLGDTSYGATVYAGHMSRGVDYSVGEESNS